jgi:hypothetical protein
MEFESWLALEHANAANAETQVYVVQLHLLHFQSVKWNMKARQLLSITMPPMLRLRYILVQLHLLHFEPVKWNLKAGQLLSMPMPQMLRLRYFVVQYFVTFFGIEFDC